MATCLSSTLLSLPTNFTPTPLLSSSSPTLLHFPKPLNSTLISLSKSGKLQEALLLIESLPSKPGPDIDSYSALLHACISAKSLEFGQRLHLHLLLSKGSSNLLQNPTLIAKLITLYSVCNRLDEARRVFDDGFGGKPVPESVCNRLDEARRVFDDGFGRKPVPESVCNRLDEARRVFDDGFGGKPVPESVCNRLDEARRVFDDGFGGKPVPESVWVAMAIGYSKNGYPREALLLYCDMLRCFVNPGNFAFSVALKSCAELRELGVGRAVHAQIRKCGEELTDQVVCNALLRLYVECGCFEEGLRVFDKMPEKNVASWNSFISGFVKRDRLFEAFGVFRRMQYEGVGFSWVTLTTMLSVCARVTALNFGKEIHARIVKSSRIPDRLLLNSLVDMYAKCGVMNYCMEIFDGMQNKDLTTWNTLITGFAINGRTREAMEIFDEMLESGYKPDSITFIALLSGCSHAGMTNEGRILFNKMSSEFGISPKLEHYSCLVDILGRGGEIEEALEIVKDMPMKPGGSIWGSLLNSCRLYGNVPLAEAIAKRLFAIEPKNPGNYVMLSNIYANAGMWEGVDSMREIMEKHGVKKEVGCSWIQIKSRIHAFVANGGAEFRSTDEFKTLWNEITQKMKEIGYVPDTKVVLHNVNEDTKAMWVCGHSERIATMYGLINTGSNVPIRISKNIRVCRDCHSWMKMVSRVKERVVTLRDTNRFHHFENGVCSCKDFW